VGWGLDGGRIQSAAAAINRVEGVMGLNMCPARSGS
jgi:hypothetical protein